MLLNWRGGGRTGCKKVIIEGSTATKRSANYRGYAFDVVVFVPDLNIMLISCRDKHICINSMYPLNLGAFSSENTLSKLTWNPAVA